MECTWDAALLNRGDQLPPELLRVIQNGSNELYLETITKASLDARYTYVLFAHCEDIFSHVCATLRNYGSLPAALATLGRIIPYAPYLTPYAIQLLSKEKYDFKQSIDPNEDLLYLLGLFRLLSFNWRLFKQHVRPDEIAGLLDSSNRPAVYVAIRILQICLSGADHWFEEMIKQHLGEDSPDGDINGQWDDKVIDYRFLSLWEEERSERMFLFLDDVRAQKSQSVGSSHRFINRESFHQSTTLIGGILLPRIGDTQSPMSASNSSLVETETIARNLRNFSTALRTTKPILLRGLAGSGKTLLVRHVARELGMLEKMVTLHLNEQSDAKLLIGIYTTGDTPGSFVWKPGVLTTAVQEGRWVQIEDLDRAPNDIVGTLLPLIEKGELFIPNLKQVIHAAQGFRIVATVRSSLNHRGEETEPLKNMLGARHWQNVRIEMPSVDEHREITNQLYPSLAALLPQFMAVYERLQSSRQRAILVGQSKTGVLRTTSPRDLLKWCSRATKLLRPGDTFRSTDMDNIFMEAVDCFVGALPDGPTRDGMAATIAEELRINPQRRDYLLTDRDVQYEVDKTKIVLGRYNLPRAQKSWKARNSEDSFSTNPHTSRMLERVASAVINREPLLLVGETGVGKTTAVQHLANHLGKKLVPFNLSQQSEAGDLLGGFKPVSARSLIIPMKDEFDELFTASFSFSKNQQFLELLSRQMTKSNWKAVCKLWQQALKMVDQQRLAPTSRQGEAPSKKRKVEAKKTIDFARWDAFATKLQDIDRRLVAGTQSFAFSFVEGSIVKAVRNGDWILLDEINLASPDTLESVADLLDPSNPSLLLAEAGNVERIEAHPEFRVFAAMNPATDIGKKDLPPGIRSRFSELFVESPDRDIKSLQSIVRSYLRHEAANDQAIALDTSTMYQKIIGLAEQNKLVDGAGQQPHFSLRTLTRTLSFAKYIAPLCNLRRALYEGFQMSFLTFLDAESALLVQPLLEHHLFGKKTNIRAELQKALRKPDDGHRYVQGYPGSKHWVRRGNFDATEEPQYILTPFIRNNLENLVRASSTRQFPVLLQGPTSSGKTSMIEYLAKRTGHKFVRINNHEHTDLQEYMGTYMSGTDGRLEFQEGILVKALREGHWIVLDELNLAPTDVLEALNRLLDDNRELLVPETQDIVRPHENFMLFATQNPAGLYGGRKPLSRAFRNRFLELHFDDIPVNELQEILHRRTQLPESRCKRIVTVYRELSVLRQENRLFEQKSFATLRDLFRWASRPNDTIEQLASNGFMLLAERVRNPVERDALQAVIEKVMSSNGMRVAIDKRNLYAQNCEEIVQYERDVATSGVVWTKAMRRLYILVSRAIKNNEPVLLVGETGCGKTTVCQILADAFGKELHTVSAHQNTETGDLIGSQRPVRNRAVIEADLRHQLLSSPMLQSLETAAAHPTDALLAEYDSAVASLEPSERSSYSQSTSHDEIQKNRTRWKSLFEWADGSLVQAMKSGSFFLLDEISLADDSVLERINSVLETQRSILLAEKGSLDSYVTAAPEFQFFATMNPGGDYGKRELSPALRNRFTEIWVPPLDDAEDIIHIVDSKLVAPAKIYSQAIVAFATWFKRRYNTTASSSMSIRDALAWVTFINQCTLKGMPTAVVHGASLVYIDTLGANPAGLMTLSNRTLSQERVACLDELSRLLEFDANVIYSAPIDLDMTERQVVAGPFSITRMSTEVYSQSIFSFGPPTTRLNTMRVIRALQLPKPVMLEGSPGVGKTALVTAVAEAVGVPLTRINLSEQTDLLDLFGSDVPMEGEQTGLFAWRDAPFLRAMKLGEWVLLDEMNLASQSVLEGLNACLDHRGEVFVPELGQTFTRHPEFKLFAAQNPHHQGSGRKGLPASFVNRFTVVFADAFRSHDLMLICQKNFPQLPADLIEKAVLFVKQLERESTDHKRLGVNGGPWEFNLRDINRWLSLASSDQGLLRSGTNRDFVHFLFSQRFRSASDRNVVYNLFSSLFGTADNASDLFSSISSHNLQLGLGLLSRNLDTAPPQTTKIGTTSTVDQNQILQSIMLAVQQQWPVILTGPSGIGKTACIERLATAIGQPLVKIAMNAETDTMDLLGGYEQADPNRRTSQLLDRLQCLLESQSRNDLKTRSSAEVLQVLVKLREYNPGIPIDSSPMSEVVRMLEHTQSAKIKEILDEIQRTMKSIVKSQFEWIDGVLIDALQQGKWLVLDNANLAGPSVLDRLNSLLEHDGVLMVNEHSTPDGTTRAIRPHPNFRVFLTMDPKYGELSRAMRNRAVEIHLPAGDPSTPSQCMDPLHTESAVARFRQTKAMCATSGLEDLTETQSNILADHTSLADQSLWSRFDRQLALQLYGGHFGDSMISQMTSRSVPHMVEVGQEVASLYKASLSQVQAPADFAYVQTLHPLNNQTLVHNSQHTYGKALTFALVHDFGLKFASICHAFDLVQLDRSVVSKLTRLERKIPHGLLQSENRAKESHVLNIFKNISQRLLDGLGHTFDATLSQLPEIRINLGQVAVLLTTVLEITQSDTVDASHLLACLTVGRNLTISMTSTATHALSECLDDISALLDTSKNPDNNRGRAITALWNALRPRMPATMKDLHSFLEFESLVDRFDRLCSQFKLPLKTMIDIRLSISRTMALAAQEGHDVEQLSKQLEETMLLPTAQEQSFVERPHFHRTFKTLHEHFAVLAMAGGALSLSPTDAAKMEVFSLCRTKDGIHYQDMVHQTAVQRQLQLLGLSVARFTSERVDEYSNSSIIPTMLKQLNTTQQVTLARMDLLHDETKTLGSTLASQAHWITHDDLFSLDAALETMLSEVLRALLKVTDDAPLQGLSQQSLALLNHARDSSAITDAVRAFSHLSISASSGNKWLSEYLHTVIIYLRTSSPTYQSQLQKATRAWSAFAHLCLELYIPSVLVDPAQTSKLRQRIHRQQSIDLASDLSSLQAFREALTGQANTIRARVLEQDIETLGPAPFAEDICRPEASQLPDLQLDLDALLRALEQLWHADNGQKLACPLNSTSIVNVTQIRSRLVCHYRAYDDLATPIVGFIDCLLTAQRLAVRASTNTDRHNSVNSQLGSVIPFVGAGLNGWLDDERFIAIPVNSLAQADQLCWLGAVALRSQILPISTSSERFRRHVHKWFEQQYLRWKAELKEDQRRILAKSSLYKFRGDNADEDENSDEALEELFPSNRPDRTDNSQGDHPQSAQDLAAEIATLHYTVFTTQNPSEIQFRPLVRQWLECGSQNIISDWSADLMPAMIQSLGDAERRLSHGDQTKSNYNMYTDANPAETKKLLGLLTMTKQHFERVHDAWPEHATPIDIMRYCDQIMRVDHSLPLSRLFSPVEKLHETINEWQSITSRELSALEPFEALTNLIVEWRRLELSTWATLFDREWQQCQRDATSWWYVAFETIMSVSQVAEEHHFGSQAHVVELLETLSIFLTSSGMGEFNARLQILRGFEGHLLANRDDDQRSDIVRQSLTNLIVYYSHFEQKMTDTVTEGRKALEKEVQNIIQLASWRDRNIEVLRQSALSSHRKLLRMVRKYRALLAQPVAPILEGDIPEQPAHNIRLARQRKSKKLDVARLQVSNDLNLSIWKRRPNRFRNASDTAVMIQSKVRRIEKTIDGQDQLLEFSHELKAAISELQKATPPFLTEHNKSLVNNLKARKRRLLADTLRDVRHMGFQSSLSQQLLSRQESHSTIFSNLPSLIHSKAIQNSAQAQHEFHRLIGIMPAIRESSRKHSEDLTSSETGRCLALLESMLQVAITQHRSISSHVASMTEIQEILDQLSNFGICNGLTVKDQSGYDRVIKLARIQCLEGMIKTCLNSLRNQEMLSGSDYSRLFNNLEDKAKDLAQIRLNVEEAPALPPNIVADENIRSEMQVDELVNALETDVRAALSSYPEIQPVVSQLMKWTDITELPDGLAQTNGHTPENAEDWIGEFFKTLDMLLGSIQDADNVASVVSKGKDQAGWLLSQRNVLNDTIQALQSSSVTSRLSGLLSKLQYLELESENDLQNISAAVHSLIPIFDAYCSAMHQLVETSCHFLTLVSSTGFSLGRAFLEIAHHGFCSPSEKRQDDTDQKGDVESGTGLGEGEGAEDISKDVGSDEDISEAAQSKAQHDESREMEDEKDAVDMADQEMDGDVDDAGQTAENNEDGDPNDNDETADIDEEPGEANASGPSAVDEKMWDEAHDENQREQEASSAEGKRNETELRAAEKQNASEDAGEQDEALDDNDQMQQEESEQVDSGHEETMDAHTRDENNLDLPEDIDMDDNKSQESGMSDIDALDDVLEHEDEQDKQATPKGDEIDAGNDDQDDISEQDNDVKAEQGICENNEVGADDETMSDSLLQQHDEDQGANEAVNGGSGTGLENKQSDEKESRQELAPGSADQDNEDQVADHGDSGATGGKSGDKDDIVGGSKAANDENRLPFKQLGDVLQQWYDQHRNIAEAQASNDETQEEVKDVANAQFQHVASEDATADAQALGAASAEESQALNEDNALPVNDTGEVSDGHFEGSDDEMEPEASGKSQDEKPNPKSSTHPPINQPTSFIGEQQDADKDVDMVDRTSTPDDERHEQVDREPTTLQSFSEEASEQLSTDDAREIWVRHEDTTRNLAFALTEQLRLVLQPTKATKMRGDFRTGKRLNIKRIIPYIASSYKRDKIWMRRSVPSKRSYQVMLAIDDSKSMKENHSQHLAFETISLVTKSMSMLEVGELSVIGFGEDVKVAHDFATPFTSDAGAEIFKRLTFLQSNTNVRKMLAESIELFRTARLKASGSASDLWQLQLIVSDGICQDHPSIRQLVRQAHEERIMIVFIVVDASARNSQAGDSDQQSILDLQTAEFVKDSTGEMQLKMVKYLDTFPFNYYLIVRDINDLPAVLAGALRQWFAEVIDTAG